MGFDQVTEGVTKIQGCSESGFGFVLLHDSCLHPAGPENRFFQKIQIQGFQFAFLKKIKQFPVMRQPMLCQFEVTCLEFTGGQGFQELEIHADMIRLLEGTDGVFPQGMIHCRFTADTAVHLSQEGGRHLDHFDSPHEGRRSKTGHVPDHSSSESHHHGSPIGLFLHQEIVNPLECFQVLVFLTVGQDTGVILITFRFKKLFDLGWVELFQSGVRHGHHPFRIKLTDGGKEGVLQISGADFDLVFAPRQFNRKGSHRFDSEEF